MSVGLHSVFNLVKAFRNVAFRVEVFGSNLSNVKVDQIAIITIEFKQLITFEASCVDIVLNVNMLVRQNVVRLSIFVTWCVDVVNFEVGTFFVFVDREEKVLSRDDFLVGSLTERLLIQLVFKVLQNKLFFNDLIDLRFDLLYFGNIRVRCLQRIKYATLFACKLQLLQILRFGLSLRFTLCDFLLRVLPKTGNWRGGLVVVAGDNLVAERACTG
jgi:hypothetical protein